MSVAGGKLAEVEVRLIRARDLTVNKTNAGACDKKLGEALRQRSTSPVGTPRSGRSSSDFVHGGGARSSMRKSLTISVVIGAPPEAALWAKGCYPATPFTHYRADLMDRKK